MTQANNGVSRRGILGATMSTAALPALGTLAGPAKAQDRTSAPGDALTFEVDVNGQMRSVSLDARTSLLDMLRETLALTGSKKGCDQGQCGACTVLVDGERVLSCLTLAISAQGSKITTIEGLTKREGELHPMQQAFIDHDAFQCGYCTPGQIMSAIGCVQEGHSGDDAEIREYMSGNLCRCAAYPNIVAAINQAKTKMERA